MLTATQQAAELRAQLVARGAVSPEARAAALLGRQVAQDEAFDAVRRRAMELAPLPARGGDPVLWLRAVWKTRQDFGRDFARELLAAESLQLQTRRGRRMSAIADTGALGNVCNCRQPGPGRINRRLGDAG